VTGADLVHLAGCLAANSALGANDEARFRSAASRAYYGAFHVVCGFLAKRPGLKILQNHHGHRQAYLHLLTIAKPEAVEAARLLDDLRADRNNADYDLSSTKFRSFRNARQCVEMAHAIQSALNACDV